MADIATLGVKVTTSGVKEAERDLKGLSAEGAKAEKRAESLGSAWGKKLGIAVLAGAGVLALGLRAVIKNTIEAEKAQAQLNAVLRSTQGAAGLTAVELNNMASALQSVTTFEDDAITGAQSLLLTFTNIGKDVFPQATKAVLDMSTALGQDLKSSSVQLGKALNDPVKGITALSRVGVSFTEEQKKLIASLVDTGQAAEAQKIILAELSKEFGGSAEAARNTLGGALEALKNNFGNLLEGDSGSDGVRGATGAVNELSAILNSPEIKSGFAAIISGGFKAAGVLASLTAQVVNLTKEVAEGFAISTGGIGGDDIKRLEARANEIRAKQAEQASRFVLFDIGGYKDQLAQDLEGVETQLASFYERQAQAGKGRLDALAGGGAAAGGASGGAAAAAFSKSGRELVEKLEEEAEAYGLSKSALLEREKAQRVAGIANEEEKRQIGEAYDALILKVKAEESAKGASKGAAGATRDAAAAERDRQRAIEEGRSALEGLSEQVRSNAADLAGPAAQAAKQYADELVSLVIAEEKLRAANLLTADSETQLAIGREQAAESYQRRLEAIEAQLTPAEQLIDDLEFELSLMGLSNLAREKEIALRYAGADATDAQRLKIEALIDAQERSKAAADGLDVLRQSTQGLFRDLMDGSKSAKEAFADFVDNILDGIARIVAQKLTESLFGSMGASGGGLFGGTSESGLGGLFSSLLGGGRAIGGPVSAGRMYEVGEKGQPELLSIYGKKFLIPGANGSVTPATNANERGGDVYQTIQVTGTVSPKSAYQIEREASMRLQKAGAR